MVNYIPLENENGQFLLSLYGSGLALGFKGSGQFIERSRNFVKNFGLSKNTKLNSLGSDCIYYITTNMERLKKALIEYYRGRVILENLVEPIAFETIEDIQFPVRDDSKVEALAESMAQKFIEDKIVKLQFMSGIEKAGLIEMSHAA